MHGFAEYVDYDGLGLAELVRTREVAATEILEAAITRIERLNPTLNAVVTKVYDEARAEAEALDAEAPFAGVPFLLKDLGGAQAGVPLSAGSRFFVHAPAPADAEIVNRHKRAGLMILGRTNTPEFGLSATTEPVLFGPTRNPWDPTRTAGGSSGGSAAAVAARMVPLAHASDGGGSIRIPASCCGLFGMKTTRNRNTLAPYAGESLAGCSVEHVVSRSVRDSAAALDATAGPAPGDPYFAPPPARPFLEEVGAPPGRLRIALTTKAFGGAPVHPDCIAAAEAAARLCEELGHVVEEAAPAFDVEGLDANYNRIFAVGAAANIQMRARAFGKDLDPTRLRAGHLGHDRDGPQHQRARLRDDGQPTARHQSRDRQVLRRLRCAADADACRAPGRTRGTRHDVGGSRRLYRAPLAIYAVYLSVQRHRPAGDVGALVLERAWPADRGAFRRTIRG